MSLAKGSTVEYIGMMTAGPARCKSGDTQLLFVTAHVVQPYHAVLAVTSRAQP